jgi:hypothetical protein
VALLLAHRRLQRPLRTVFSSRACAVGQSIRPGPPRPCSTT